MRTTLTIERNQLQGFLCDQDAVTGVGFHATGQALSRRLQEQGFDFSLTLGGPLGCGFYLAETEEQALRHWRSGVVVEVAYRIKQPADSAAIHEAREQARKEAGEMPVEAFEVSEWISRRERRLGDLLLSQGFDGAVMNTRGGLVVCLYETADYRLVG